MESVATESTAARTLGRTLGMLVCALAIFNTIWAASLPRAARPPATGRVVVWAVLLCASGAAFVLGHRMRQTRGLFLYLAAQAALAFALGATGAPFGAVLAIFAAATGEAVILLERRWPSAAVTAVAIVLFAAAEMIGSTLYQGATAAMVLVGVALVAHLAAVIILPQLKSRQLPSVSAAPTIQVALDGLTAREQEVLVILARGARTAEIARELDIAERTVKSHLARIYQKLGVASRAEAVAYYAQRASAR
jgi:DNA-binding CsgD family transcriptional regulator